MFKKRVERKTIWVLSFFFFFVACSDTRYIHTNCLEKITFNEYTWQQ